MRSMLNTLVTMAAVTAFSAAASAVPTVQNFDNPGTAYTAATHQGTAAPGVLGGGPTNNFYRLAAQGVGSTQNSIAFDNTHAGNFELIQADMDVRITPSGRGADGFSVMFLNTADYGTTGALNPFPNPIEEPNLTNSFAFALDVWEGDNTTNQVSLHNNGALVDQQNFDQSTFDINLENGVFNHVSMFLEPVAGGSNVSLSMTDGTDGSVTNFYSDFFIAGLNPYETRLALGGRTGGVTADFDVDNILVAYQPALPEPATMTGAAMGLIALLGWRRRRSA